MKLMILLTLKKDRNWNSIIEPNDPRKYLDDIINGLGDEEYVGLYKVIEELAKHPEWNSYTESVRNWLINEKGNLGL